MRTIIMKVCTLKCTTYRQAARGSPMPVSSGHPIIYVARIPSDTCGCKQQNFSQFPVPCHEHKTPVDNSKWLPATQPDD